jgi:hypothetical protein
VKPRSAATTAAILLLAASLMGCQTQPSQPAGIDAPRAVELALAFVSQGQPSGTTFNELTAGDPVLNNNKWRIPVDARIVYPQETQELAVHYLLDVDALTGGVVIVAQG